MGRSLNFGKNQITTPPWENLASLLSTPLTDGGGSRVADGSVSRIVLEHVIGRVTYARAWSFLQECFRVLAPGGVLRMTFADPVALLTVTVDTAARAPLYTLGLRAAEYAAELGERMRSRDPTRGAMEDLLTSDGEGGSAWSHYIGVSTLLALGFEQVRQYRYGEGQLGEFDAHANLVGERVARWTTCALEAKK
jgi:hypothetical protein